jgi:hypothetical protein
MVKRKTKEVVGLRTSSSLREPKQPKEKKVKEPKIRKPRKVRGARGTPLKAFRAELSLRKTEQTYNKQQAIIQKQLEQNKLNRQRATAEQATRQKETFLATGQEQVKQALKEQTEFKKIIEETEKKQIQLIKKQNELEKRYNEDVKKVSKLILSMNPEERAMYDILLGEADDKPKNVKETLALVTEAKEKAIGQELFEAPSQSNNTNENIQRYLDTQLPRRGVLPEPIQQPQSPTLSTRSMPPNIENLPHMADQLMLF